MNNLITLPIGSDALSAFDQLLARPDRVYLLVLGRGEVQQSLLDQTIDIADDWRYVAYAPNPTPLFNRLLSLDTRPGVLALLPDAMEEVLGVSLAVQNTICTVIKELEPGTAAYAFILAETYQQPGLASMRAAHRV